MVYVKTECFFNHCSVIINTHQYPNLVYNENTFNSTTAVTIYIDGPYQPLKEITIKKTIHAQNAGDTTLSQVTTPGKSFSYPCKLSYCDYILPIVSASGLVHDGDSFV